MKYTACIVGRPNTGKSTLFNKLVGRKISIIEDSPGVTRDRIISTVNYNDYSFHLVDTGGIELEKNFFNDEIKTQVLIGIEEADVIIFVVDGKDGLTANDKLIRDMLRKSGKNVVVAINKIDSKITDENIYDFYELGFDTYVPISAEHNIGFTSLLDEVVKNFSKCEVVEEDDTVKLCVVGRPNVGKSSLVNAVLGEERVIVSPIAGTTRDAIDTKFKYEGNDYTIIDTAGLRKKGKVFESIEKYSLLRSLKAIDRSDVCLLVINREEGIIEHDKHIASYILEAGKAVVIVVNKWDGDFNKDSEMKKWKTLIECEFQFMPYAQVVFLSALTTKRIHTLMPEVLKAYSNWVKEIKTSVINEIVTNAFIETPPPSYKGRRLKIYFTHQNGTKPPRFDIEVNSKGLLHFSYARYIENQIRANIDFTGTPLNIMYKNKGE
ncbi:MAG: ribosome biogenesis GTPase Der [Bacilli bacterium]